MVSKQLLSVFCSIFVVGLFFLLLPSHVFAFSGSGAGTSGDPYIITTCSQLQEMSSALSSDYKLGNDIDCNVSPYNTGTGFTPVGDSFTQFSGIFDGSRHTISGLFIDDTSNDYVGLFGSVNGATIKNVELKSVNITGGERVGGLVGDTDATNGVTIDKVDVSGSVSASRNLDVAGLVGLLNAGTVSNVYSTATVTGTGKGAGYVLNVGDLIGYSGGTIENAYASGNVTATTSGSNSDAYAGGLVGQTDGSSGVIIKNSYATGTESASGGTINNDTGGLTGYCGSGGSITNSYSVNTPLCGVTNGTTNGGSTGGVSLSSFYKTSPSYAVYTTTPVWDFDNTWAFNDSSSLPVFTWPETTVSSTSASSNSGSASTPSCNDSAPTEVPNLFQIDTAGTYANLYFTTVQDASGYRINYGLDQNANQYGDNWNYSGPEWVSGRTINDLAPNTTYYFKIQADKGCNVGGWSKTVQVKTKSRFSDITQWFANLVHQTPLPAESSNSVLGTSISCNYTIQKGDSLWSLSQSKWGTGTNFSQILTLNPNLSQTSILRVGQTLKLCQ